MGGHKGEAHIRQLSWPPKPIADERVLISLNSFHHKQEGASLRIPPCVGCIDIRNAVEDHMGRGEYRDAIDCLALIPSGTHVEVGVDVCLVIVDDDAFHALVEDRVGPFVNSHTPGVGSHQLPFPSSPWELCVVQLLPYLCAGNCAVDVVRSRTEEYCVKAILQGKHCLSKAVVLQSQQGRAHVVAPPGVLDDIFPCRRGRRELEPAEV